MRDTLKRSAEYFGFAGRTSRYTQFTRVSPELDDDVDALRARVAALEEQLREQER